MDAAEMASQPRCTLENAQADFGELRFAEPKSTTFRLVNTGDVAATWRFVSAVPGATDGAPPCPRAGSSWTRAREFCCPARRWKSQATRASRAGAGWTRVRVAARGVGSRGRDELGHGVERRVGRGVAAAARGV